MYVCVSTLHIMCMCVVVCVPTAVLALASGVLHALTCSFAQCAICMCIHNAHHRISRGYTSVCTQRMPPGSATPTSRRCWSTFRAVRWTHGRSSIAPVRKHQHPAPIFCVCSRACLGKSSFSIICESSKENAVLEFYRDQYGL